MMTRSESRATATALFGMVVLGLSLSGPVGCEETPTGAPSDFEQSVIGAEGGEIVGPSGAELVIPEGALSQEMTVAIQEVTEGYPDPMNLELSSPVFAFLPHGMRFSQPVTVRLPLQDGASYAMVTASAGGEWFHVRPAVEIDGFLEVQVPHFSFFALTPSSSVQIPASDGDRAHYCGAFEQQCCAQEPSCMDGLTCWEQPCSQTCFSDQCFDLDCEGLCFELSEFGEFCYSDEDCAEGRCVDDVCCRTACEGQCEACDVPGYRGTCVPVEGVPRNDRPACENAYHPTISPCGWRCDGEVTDACVPVPVDTPCGSSCMEETSPTQGMIKVCNGLGVCDVGFPFSCAPYRCRESSGTCDVTCAYDEDCDEGALCIDAPGRCVYFTPYGECSASGEIYYFWTRPDEFVNYSCNPYVCDLDMGGCLHRCTSNYDCLPPTLCSSDAECIVY